MRFVLTILFLFSLLGDGMLFAQSKEALEFAEEVNEMKITKRQLKKIIKEELLTSSKLKN